MALLTYNDNGELVLTEETENRLKTIAEEKAKLEQEETKLKNDIKSELKTLKIDKTTKIGCVSYQITQPFITLEVDMAKLRAEYPTAYKSCLVAKEHKMQERIVPNNRKGNE